MVMQTTFVGQWILTKTNRIKTWFYSFYLLVFIYKVDEVEMMVDNKTLLIVIVMYKFVSFAISSYI